MSMDSSITSVAAADDFDLKGRLAVNHSETGHTFYIGCDGSTPVATVQRMLESFSGVQFADQLLMCGRINLEPQQPLAHYKLPHPNREVFLFNKASLLADSPCPPPELIDVPGAVIPSPSSPLNDSRPLGDSSDPALKALAQYERQFRYHYNYARAIHKCTEGKLEICARLLREKGVQERALDTVRGNLEHTFKRLQQRYMEFVKCFAQQRKVHGELLASFDSDLERLRSLRLHPAIQSEGRKSVLDLVKVSDLTKWKEICLNSHRQFESKVSQLKMSFGELKRGVENVLASINSGNSKELEGSVTDHQKLLNNQKIILQSLSKDVDTVKKLVDDFANCEISASLRPHDAVSALGPMYDVHEKNHLPKVQNSDNLVSKFLDKCKRKKDDMNLLVHTSLRKVKSVQCNVKDLMNQLHAFEEVMGHQDKEFENVRFVNGVGHAYRACLAEVIRRKSSLKLYMGLAGQLAERLATEREAEIRRREGFYKAWSKYIPHDILAAMGLFDFPSQCDVNMAPFDTNLLEIDVADVDRYAPQAVVGFPLKSEKNRLSKSDLATSSESCNFNKLDETAPDAQANTEFDEGLIDEGCESVDIAGTSKIEVENARLKAELASAIALICTFNAGIGYDPFDKCEPDEILKVMKEKTAEALQLKDEYVKHLQSMLNMKHAQCSSYEKRIQELELRLENQYAQGQKLSVKDTSQSVLFGDAETQIPCISTVSMDETSSISAVDQKHDFATGQKRNSEEGGDENMQDLLGVANMQSSDSARNSMDASMQETSRHEQQDDIGDHEVSQKEKDLAVAAKRGTKMMTEASNSGDNLPCGAAADVGSQSTASEAVVLELQKAMGDKSNQLIETENQLKAAVEEVESLRRELESSRTLLDESQLNCAHLENCLHEAREEARTNLCAADRKATEYSALRKSALKMHSLFERFRSCVTAQVGVANFADTLRSLALSFASSGTEDEDNGTAEFRLTVKVLADKVCLLSRHLSELMERCPRAETALEEKTDLVKSLYTKLQLEKQASKEKISFVRLQVHELACFVLNPVGHYEAIHRNCSNYYLSAESVALFTTQYSRRPLYVIGQIVHIERKTTKRLSTRAEVEAEAQNSYGLPPGSEYFIVTVAMLPDTTHSSSS